jgi:hypothetical protein
LDLISSTVIPGALSNNLSPLGVTSNTAISLTIFFTHLTPVSGSVHFGKSLDSPFGFVCIMATMMFFALATRSIAPPIPFTIFPGIFQFAISPFSLTSIAPSTVRSTFPARIIPKLMALSKKAEPGTVVIVCLPALIRSGSSSPSNGKGPMPNKPFSLCKITSMPFGI